MNVFRYKPHEVALLSPPVKQIGARVLAVACLATLRSQRVPGRQRVHVVSPVRDLSVLDLDD